MASEIGNIPNISTITTSNKIWGVGYFNIVFTKRPTDNEIIERFNIPIDNSTKQIIINFSHYVTGSYWDYHYKINGNVSLIPNIASWYYKDSNLVVPLTDGTFKASLPRSFYEQPQQYLFFTIQLLKKYGLSSYSLTENFVPFIDEF